MTDPSFTPESERELLVVYPDAARAAAATRGVLIRVDHDTAELRHLLAGLDPIRMDEVSHAGDPIATVSTEAGDPLPETGKEPAVNAAGDDYHPER